MFPANIANRYIIFPSPPLMGEIVKEKRGMIFCNVAKCNLVKVKHEAVLARGLHYLSYVGQSWS